MLHKDLNIEDKIVIHKAMEEKLNYKFIRLNPNDPKHFFKDN